MSYLPPHVVEPTARSSSPVAPATSKTSSASISSPVRMSSAAAPGGVPAPPGAIQGKDLFSFRWVSSGASDQQPPAQPAAANDGIPPTQGPPQNSVAGLIKDGQHAPTDSISLGQLKSITAAFPKAKQTLYTFPSPPPDTSDLRSELEEFYSYVEVGSLLSYKDAFSEDWPHSTSFVDIPREQQLLYVKLVVGSLSSESPETRTRAARHLVYLSHGSFASSTSPEHHLHLVLSNSALLRAAGALGPLWDALKAAQIRWEALSGAVGEEVEDQEKQDSLDEVNVELSLLMAVLYFMVEAHRGDDEWADEMMALEPPMAVHLFNMVASLRDRNAKGYPIKKLLVLMWKSFLATMGGIEDVDRTKVLVREIEGLPTDEQRERTGQRPDTKVSPIDLLTFKNEMSSKYPSFVTAAPLPAPIPNVDLDRISAAALPAPVRPTFSYHTNPNHISPLPPTAIPAAPPQPPTPAPTPPQSPAAPPQKPKKQQYQTDQSRPFVLPFSPANAGPKGRLRAVPQSIEEAAELYKGNMRVSTELWQTWKLREEFMADERGFLRAEMEEKRGRRMEEIEEPEEDPLTILIKMREQVVKRIESEQDEKQKQKLTTRKTDLKRLERVEIFYRAVLPHTQSAIIVLLKLLLATVTANSALNQSAVSETDDMVEVAVEDVDIVRHREITSKAVSAVLLLVLKWFKTSHVMKYQYFAQLLVDSNCILLILKMFGLQEVSTSVKTKTDRPSHNLFQFCHDAINPPSPGSQPRAEDVLLQKSPPGVRPTTPGPHPGSPPRDDDDAVELITDYSWRNFFSTINFVHVLQKLTKKKTHRILLLVQYKSSAILKRILKVAHPTLQLYVLKVIKSQIPYCGRKWRQSNMKVITAIYMYCRPDLRDEWLMSVDLDADVEDSLPNEHALRALVKFFNTRYYATYAPTLYRRSSSQEPGGADFGGPMPPPSPSNRPPSENDAFPPTRSVANFDPERNAPRHSPSSSGLESMEDLDYAVEDLLYPQYDANGDLNLDPLTSQAAWDRLGNFMGHWDDISDSESVGSLDFFGLDRDEVSDGSVSDLDIDEEVDEQKNLEQWESISPETITALEEERNADAAAISPRPRRRSSTGPISPALRPVLIDLDEDACAPDETEDGPAPTEPHGGRAIDEVELIWNK